MSRIFWGAGKEHPTNSMKNRDLLIYFLWGSGHYKNKEISKLFGLVHSAVIHYLRKNTSKPEQDATLKKKFNDFNKQLKG
jgi:predicted transcriptional regulator